MSKITIQMEFEGSDTKKVQASAEKIKQAIITGFRIYGVKVNNVVVNVE